MYSAATHPCRHRYFFGVADLNLGCFRSNIRAIERRLPGRDFKVRCGHCGVMITGLYGHGGDKVEIVWRHDGQTFFGEFYLVADQYSGIVPGETPVID